MIGPRPARGCVAIASGVNEIRATVRSLRAIVQDEFDRLIQIAALEERRLAYACTMTRDGETLAAGTMAIACATLGQPLRGIPVPPHLARALRGRGELTLRGAHYYIAGTATL